MAQCRKRSLAFDPAYCLSVPDWRVMLSCSTNSSLDRAPSRSRGQPHGETLHFLGSLKSVPCHQCLGNRTHLLCPWEKGAITQVKQKEALYHYAPMLGHGLLLFDTEDSRAVWTEKVLGPLLTSL